MTGLESLFASMTLADLARFAGTSVVHVVDIAYSGRSASPSKAAAPKSTMSNPTKAGKVPRGGLLLDAVLAAVASVGGPAKIEDVQAKTGGSVEQVRAALKKLAAANRVAITGQRRGTRYASP